MLSLRSGTIGYSYTNSLGALYILRPQATYKLMVLLKEENLFYQFLSYILPIQAINVVDWFFSWRFS